MNVTTKLGTNRILAVIFTLGSAWALVTAFSFPSRDALFPQIAAAIILVGSVAILLLDLLPASVSDKIASADDLFNTSELAEEGRTGPEVQDDRARYVLVLLTGGYLVVGYLVGLLWATPAFTLAYSVATGQKSYVVVLQTALSFGIAYGFMEILNLSIGEGVLTG